MILNNRSGYVCSSCRMVFSVSRAMGGSVVCCPGCADELSLPELADNVAVLGEVVEGHAGGGSEVVVIDHHRGSDVDEYAGGGGKVALIILSCLAAVLMVGCLGYYLLSGWNDGGVQGDGVIVHLDDEVNGSGGEEVMDAAYVFDPDNVEHTERLEEFLKGVFAAKTVNDLMTYVDSKPGIRGKMESFYDGKTVSTSSYKLLHNAMRLRDESGTVSFHCQTEDYENHIGVVRYSEDEILLDWESFVAYSEMSWMELAEKKPTEPVMLRVVAKKAHYYNGVFSDEDKWQAVVLMSPNEEEPIYGYVKKKSSDAGRLFNFGLSDNQGVIITVCYPEGATEGNQVLINSVVQSGWAIKKEK